MAGLGHDLAGLLASLFEAWRRSSSPRPRRCARRSADSSEARISSWRFSIAGSRRKECTS